MFKATHETKYAIIDNQDRFVYIDQGEIEFDSIVRKSGSTTVPKQVLPLLARVKKAQEKSITYFEGQIKEYKGHHCAPNWQQMLKELKSLKFSIVEFSVKTVPQSKFK